MIEVLKNRVLLLRQSYVEKRATIFAKQATQRKWSHSQIYKKYLWLKSVEQSAHLMNGIDSTQYFYYTWFAEVHLANLHHQPVHRRFVHYEYMETQITTEQTESQITTEHIESQITNEQIDSFIKLLNSTRHAKSTSKCHSSVYFSWYQCYWNRKKHEMTERIYVRYFMYPVKIHKPLDTWFCVLIFIKKS